MIPEEMEIMIPEDLETHISRTPILDRLAPLPPQAPPRSGMIVVIVVWLCVLMMLAASVLLGRPPMLRQWLLNDMPKWIKIHGMGTAIAFAAVSTVVVSFAMVAVHEVGHLLGGIAVGFQ